MSFRVYGVEDSSLAIGVVATKLPISLFSKVDYYIYIIKNDKTYLIRDAEIVSCHYHAPRNCVLKLCSETKPN